MGFRARVAAAFLSFGIVFLTATSARAQSEASFHAEELTLPNGLHVILHEDHRTPQVAVDVWYDVGFADDPPGRRGLAHLFEHLMLRGSKHVGRDRYFSYVEHAGASDRDATTTMDRTVYLETVPSNQLELALWLESDRMGFFLDVLDDAMLATEKNVVKNEYRSGMVDRPYAFVRRFAQNALYPPGHPYHWVVEGELDDTDAITTADARRFFEAHYGPRNATLVLSGDFEPKAARALVARYFATLPDHASARPPARATAGAPTGERRLVVEAGTDLSRIVLGWVGPPERSDGDVDLALLADVLAHGSAGRLHASVVRGAELATAAYASQDAMGTRHARTFWLSLDLKKGVSHEKALEEVDRLLDELRRNGPTTDEVREAQARWQANLLWSIERATERAYLLNALHAGGGIARLPEMQQHARAATPAALREAAARWLPRDRRVVVLAKAKPGAPVGGALVKETTR